jgi:hypothetical protein
MLIILMILYHRHFQSEKLVKALKEYALAYQPPDTADQLCTPANSEGGKDTSLRTGSATPVTLSLSQVCNMVYLV